MFEKLYLFSILNSNTLRSGSCILLKALIICDILKYSRRHPLTLVKNIPMMSFIHGYRSNSWNDYTNILERYDVANNT